MKETNDNSESKGRTPRPDETQTAGTQGGQTQWADPKEIEKERQLRERRRIGLRRIRFLVFIVCCLGVLFLYLKTQKPLETSELDLPMAKVNGKMEEKVGFHPVFAPNDKDGKVPMFQIAFPDVENVRVESNPDSVTIRSFLGRKADVPVVISLVTEQSNDFLFEDFETGMKNAVSRLQKKSANRLQMHLLNAVSGFFFPKGGGAANGLRNIRLTYQREGWFGMFRFFRNADVNYMLFVEVPWHEKDRSIKLLTMKPFISFENVEFISRCWDGGQPLREPPLKGSFEDFRDEFNVNDSPLQYSTQELELKKYMADFIVHGNQEGLKEALELLGILREKRMNLYYNKLRMRWINSSVLKKEEDVGKKTPRRKKAEEVRRQTPELKKEEASRKRQIRIDAELVFSNPSDARYDRIRRDKWNEEKRWVFSAKNIGAKIAFASGLNTEASSYTSSKHVWMMKMMNMSSSCADMSSMEKMVKTMTKRLKFPPEGYHNPWKSSLKTAISPSAVIVMPLGD